MRSSNSTVDINKSIAMEIKRYIDENLCDDISLNDFADKYYISNSYLSKVFKQATGITFKKYLYTSRINYAKKLLLAGDNPRIAEISSMVGFRDVCYFYRVFRKVEGRSPMEYINDNRARPFRLKEAGLDGY